MIKLERSKLDLWNDANVRETVAHPEINQILKARFLTFIDFLSVSLLVILTVYLDCIVYADSLSESSLTELSQQILAGVAAYSFLGAAFKQYPFNRAKFLFGCFYAVIFVREMDHWLDFVVHGFWAFPALLIAGIGLYVFFSKMSVSHSQLLSLLTNKHFGLLILGTTLLVVFSRLVGMGDFWKAVMDDNYVRIVKQIAEEGTELLAYYLIALASVKICKPTTSPSLY
ncbi:hypothetical protein L3Q72_07960 [Vibrio sp. JC009]|uniref:hypothetical protein n=1 Tax=Vibrio sp. JC009 TaxID=2912314 RepID=UPI0023AF978D|nr:hypothetical protein [Vibrio sp. JC009]WED20587.1 hypothetical protein L3Q72_07960 [Vibrio sp. JC009]